MSVIRSLEEICEIKDKISQDIAGMSHEEIIQYFRKNRPDWADSLPRFEKPQAKSTQRPSPFQRPKPDA